MDLSHLASSASHHSLNAAANGVDLGANGGGKLGTAASVHSLLQLHKSAGDYWISQQVLGISFIKKKSQIDKLESRFFFRQIEGRPRIMKTHFHEFFVICDFDSFSVKFLFKTCRNVKIVEVFGVR